MSSAGVITRDAVIWAYRLFLDREPESWSSVDDKVDRIWSFPQLRREFLGSAEYASKKERFENHLFTGSEPPMSVALELSKREIDALYSHIKKVWEELGRTEPHWSVLSSEAFRSSNVEKNLGPFYDSGKIAADKLMMTLRRNNIDHESIGSVMEYGCGLGRVTSHLADNFPTVEAYDISCSHLDAARNYLDSRNIRNVHLHHVVDLASLDNLPSVDLVYSIIVLQHNPPPVIEFTTNALLACLAQGGVAYFQVPTYRAGYAFTVSEYLQREGQGNDIEMHVLPQSRIFEIIRRHGAKVLEVIEDDLAGVGNGIRSNTFVVQK